MINRYIEDQRLYITVGSDATEVECDLSFDSIEIPCTIMDGPLMGFEIMLDRAFILRKAREEQGEDVYWHPHDGNIDVPLQWKWRTTMDDRVCMHYVIDRLEDILEEDTIDASKLIEFKRELIYNLGINQRIAYGEDE